MMCTTRKKVINRAASQDFRWRNTSILLEESTSAQLCVKRSKKPLRSFSKVQGHGVCQAGLAEQLTFYEDERVITDKKLSSPHG